ncbi:type I toxin-antitoxin system SymE family toxin, partial [Citrobacter portucalensis]
MFDKKVKTALPITNPLRRLKVRYVIKLH